MDNALTTLSECLEIQTKTSEKVLENLQSEIKHAVNLEKQNKIMDTASEFGVAAKNVSELRGKLIPVLPKIFKEVESLIKIPEIRLDTTSSLLTITYSL